MNDAIPETSFEHELKGSCGCPLPAVCICPCHRRDTQPIPETDLVKIAEREVIDISRRMLKAWRAMGISTGMEFDARKLEYNELQCELLASVTLLNCREAMNNTDHLDELKERAV